jgi:thioester reductase-like protein
MSRPGYDSVLLVTGFPSFYARKMVEHVLAEEPKTLVYLIVLEKFLAEAAAELDALPADRRARVVVLEGDCAGMDMGLSGAEYRSLGREVDRIHHMAHASFVGVDEETAHALNVVGTAEVLELARNASQLGQLESVVVHSTALVAGDRTGVVYEDDLDAGQSFRNVVEKTRMKGEVVARRSLRELPLSIVRPTTIVGDSGTGEVDRFDGLYFLVLVMVAAPAELAIPLPAKGDAPLSVVPIDFVIRAAHHIGRSPAARGRTFHLADPHPLTARRVFELIARAGGRRTAKGYIPSNIARALLRTPGLERFVRSPRAFVEQLASAVRYDTRNADQILAGSGIVCPPFESYVDQIIGVVQERVRSRRERREALEIADVEDPLS